MAKKYNPALQSFMSSLLDRIDPHREPDPGPTPTEQVTAGRWLAQRRIALRLDMDALAKKSSLAQNDLLLIEAGVAKPDVLDEQARSRLATALADTRVEYDAPNSWSWITAVIDVACGQPAADVSILSEVIPMLNARFTDAALADAMLVEHVPIVADEPITITALTLREAFLLDLLGLREHQTMSELKAEFAAAFGKSVDIGELLERFVVQNVVTFEVDPRDGWARYRVTTRGKAVFANVPIPAGLLELRKRRKI